jgi:hypothetical protein
MRITINNSVVVYDDELGIGVSKPATVGVPVLPIMAEDNRKLFERILPEFIGIVGVTSALAIIKPAVVFAADASARLVAKEHSIIHMLQTITTPAAIAIALWGLIEWAVMNNPHGKKKIWESLWLLIGIKFIPDIWETIAT